VLRDRDGAIRYAMVDFELLSRTPDYHRAFSLQKRQEYLKRQRDRFEAVSKAEFYPHLYSVNILGIDYIYGNVESTKGRLWVVGKDPFLFDYFLPDRWEKTHKTRLSEYRDLFYTVSKDNIHLVWEVSGVGIKPDMDPSKSDERLILDYGYNSPFEEVSLAVNLAKKGMKAIYPRGIYMTGTKADIPDYMIDESRYKMHAQDIMPDGLPILEHDHTYIIIWGYWNGPDEKLASKDGDYYEGIDALRAYREGIIEESTYHKLVERARKELLHRGVQDLNLRGSHILISLDSSKNIVLDEDGLPEIRISNFEFFKKLV
jgi:hypothetical protein